MLQVQKKGSSKGQPGPLTAPAHLPPRSRQRRALAPPSSKATDPEVLERDWIWILVRPNP